MGHSNGNAAAKDLNFIKEINGQGLTIVNKNAAQEPGHQGGFGQYMQNRNLMQKRVDANGYAQAQAQIASQGQLVGYR